MSPDWLSSAWFQILVRLSESTTRDLEQRELSASLEWSASRLSHQLSRMERRRQITRDTEGPGHVVEIALTPRGQEVVLSALHIHTPGHRKALLELVARTY